MIRADSRAPKPKLDSVARLRDELNSRGWPADLDDDSLSRLLAIGLRGPNLLLAAVATNILIEEKPITLRGLFYRVVSAGCLPSTDRQHYARLGRLLTLLRERGFVRFAWLVDNVRSTVKPSSWSGIADFVETVQDAYRLDFWAGLPAYVHVVVEKDAIAGVVQPVTREFDVPLSPIRGYVSLSFANEIASSIGAVAAWKACHVFYLGDFDPSGFDLERDVREKLARYCSRSFSWTRLGVNTDDFRAHELLPLDVKTTDRRAAKFVAEHGEACAELDALPATEIRRRVREAIESHIPADEWARLQDVETRERESFRAALGTIATNGGDHDAAP